MADEFRAREFLPGELYVLGTPQEGARFVKILGAGETIVYLRPYASPPLLRWRIEPSGVPVLLIEAQAKDREIKILEVSREEFDRWGTSLAARSGTGLVESDALDEAILRKVPVIPDALLAELMDVEPSRDADVEYRPCRVHLRNGDVVDRAYVVEAEPWIHLWGIWPELDKHKNAVSMADVVKIEESPFRIPVHVANKMYEAGESAMGGCFFTLVLSDGRRFQCETGNVVDFVELPGDVDVRDIVDLIPHEGRMARGRLKSSHAPWCLYRLSG